MTSINTLSPNLQESFLLGYATEDSYGRRYTTGIGLNYIKGNKDSHWTLNNYEQEPRLKRMFKSIHKELFKYLGLHLSDTEGVPMYAVENGYYFYTEIIKTLNDKDYQTDSYTTYTPATLASHLRITEEEAVTELNKSLRKEEFIALVDSMRPRWKRESEELYQLLSSVKHLSEI